MDAIKLNLARKWRSKTFDQVVGQQLSIRMIKNSLYLDQFFPVYLFSGSRGCGKTTTARIFAAALNCSQLLAFQKDPQRTVLPCLVCDSCVAMAEGKHPDFIEMDAASHTGVDSIRQLIESSSLMPVMGRKKVYLIDEAHMLSRSSFNALLKLLEEPPASVLFILATTDPEKIIDTVRSRCFRLLFKPIQSAQLITHLQHVCTQEKIRYDDDGLELIVQETEGSARDALNMIEQVRFARGTISREYVQLVLGHLDTATIVSLCEYIFCKAPHELLAFVHEKNLHEYAPDHMWHKCVAMIRALLWLKYGVKPEGFKAHWPRMIKLAGQCSIKQLNAVLKEFYASEQLFMRTSEQYGLFEMLLLRACQDFSNSGNQGAPSSPVPALVSDQVDQDGDTVQEDGDEEDDTDDEHEDEDDEASRKWNEFVRSVESLEDPLLNSVFQQGECKVLDVSKNILSISFSKDFIFFQDLLDKTRAEWRPLLEAIFGKSVDLQLCFTRESMPRKIAPKNTEQIKESVNSVTVPVEKKIYKEPIPAKPWSGQHAKAPSRFRSRTQENKKQSGPVVDISDATVWKKANLLTSFFPGTVTELQEGHYQ